MGRGQMLGPINGVLADAWPSTWGSGQMLGPVHGAWANAWSSGHLDPQKKTISRIRAYY
jgi:hypothetical protein